MGLLTEGINEIIATTKQNDLPNAAPVGVINRGGSYKIVLFKGSHTVENVLKDGIFTANLIFDPVIYVKTAFDDLEEDFFAEESFGEISFYRLKDAEGFILFKAELLQETGEAYIFELHPLKEEILNPKMRPVNRGFNSIIDAAVHATRYVNSHSPELKALIDYDISIAKKCGGVKEAEAVSLLNEYLG